MKYTDRYNEKGLAMLKEREAELGIYHIGNWSFSLSEEGDFCVKFDYENSDWDNMRDKEDFSAVITEAKKHGYNVDAEFLKEQIEIILLEDLKQNRFLPDKSGQVFSPIGCNGIIFRFSPITEESIEYIC